MDGCWFCDEERRYRDSWNDVAYAYFSFDGCMPQITYDNSGGEYGEGHMAINYCPICGLNLTGATNPYICNGRDFFITV